jgi:hypothetical protein
MQIFHKLLFLWRENAIKRFFCSVGRRLKVHSELFLLVHCLYQMLPLTHKRITSSLAPPLFYVAKKLAIKRLKVPHCFLTVRFCEVCFI